MDRRNNAETEPEPRCLARSVTQTSSNLSSPIPAWAHARNSGHRIVPAMRRIALALLFSLVAADCLAQWKPGEDVSGTRQVASYSYGVGRLEWTFPASLHAIFAVPHWSAGPRVKCSGEKPGQQIECEVEVQARSLPVSREERRRQ